MPAAVRRLRRRKITWKCSIFRAASPRPMLSAAGLCPHHARLQQILHLLRRSLHPRPRSASPAGKYHRRSQKTHRRRRDGSRRCSVRRSITTLTATATGARPASPNCSTQIHEAVPDLPRLRFVTSFPRDFTDEALQAMRDCPRICRYLHVPAQHGSDRILKMMNRGYTACAIPRFSRPRQAIYARHLHRQRFHRRLPHRN